MYDVFARAEEDAASSISGSHPIPNLTVTSENGLVSVNPASGPSFGLSRPKVTAPINSYQAAHSNYFQPSASSVSRSPGTDSVGRGHYSPYSAFEHLEGGPSHDTLPLPPAFLPMNTGLSPQLHPFQFETPSPSPEASLPPSPSSEATAASEAIEASFSAKGKGVDRLGLGQGGPPESPSDLVQVSSLSLNSYASTSREPWLDFVPGHGTQPYPGVHYVQAAASLASHIRPSALVAAGGPSAQLGSSVTVPTQQREHSVIPSRHMGSSGRRKPLPQDATPEQQRTIFDRRERNRIAQANRRAGLREGMQEQLNSLQEENSQLREEIQSLRQAYDILSGRYHELQGATVTQHPPRSGVSGQMMGPPEGTWLYRG